MAADVGERQQEHVVDDVGEAFGLQDDHVERFAILRFGPGASEAQRDLRSRASDGDWCAQLMRRIGHEPALDSHRISQSIEEGVERDGKALQLVGRLGYG